MSVEYKIMLFIKTFFMNLSTFLAITKITNCKNLNKIIKIILINCMISSLNIMLYSIFRLYINPSIINIMVYTVYAYIVTYIVKSNNKQKVALIIISLSFTYIGLIVATMINFLLKKFTILNGIDKNIIEFIILGTLQYICIYSFFKIKRFKDGLSFFREDSNMQKLNYVGIILACLIIFICILYCLLTDNFIGTFIFGGILLGTCLMIYWIRKSITNYYKKQMKQRTMELHAKQIDEKNKIIKDLKEELENALKINHKYSHRLSAMEKAVEKLGEKLKYNEEFGTEYADILNSIKDLSKEYRHELYETTNIKKLPKTNIFSIDNLLEYMKTEAEKQNIEFNLEIHNDINNMVKNIISKSKLETLIGDHIKDAIIAINCSNNKNRKILLSFNMNNEIYEIKFKDTGIEFEINTLLKLGLEKTTTHKETGGSGIGFMTTFETMNECRASLIIEEQPISNNNYTKTITIKFDGKNEYKIISYRAGEIKKETNSNRIIIEKI